MYRFSVIASVLIVLMATAVLSPETEAQQWNKRTIVTITQPMEIPGVGQHVLPAGTYVFKLVDSLSNRDIVQIFNEEESHVFATILTIPNYRLKPTDETVITFEERPTGKPEAIHAWFYPGATWGQEFVYPRTRAFELAKETEEPVLFMPSELAPEITRAVQPSEEPPEALKRAPVEAVTPKGEEVEIAQVVEPPPTETTMARLPQTGSSLPLFGLIGMLFVSAAFLLSLLSKGTALHVRDAMKQ
jgi:LPXTG-motif cell wall-anchored protein